MKVSTWAEIRRLHEIEKLSKRAIAKQVRCSRRTIDRALALQEPPSTKRETLPKKSILDPYKPKIDAIIKQYPDLSAVRILEKIAVNDGVTPGYTGRISQLKSYLRTIRPIQGRVYQDIIYSPGEAIQIDWGDVGSVKINNTIRKVSVFVAVLCYSRMCYIEFTLSQRKSEFYRCLSNALKFYGGSPKKVIFDNLKAAVISQPCKAVIPPYDELGLQFIIRKRRMTALQGWLITAALRLSKMTFLGLPP